MSYKQYIVMNRGLKMSRGKLMAQAAHASMAFLTNLIRDCVYIPRSPGDDCVYADLVFGRDFYDGWLNGPFTKVVLAVDSEEELVELIGKLEESGFHEGWSFFVIRDNCQTELEPDESGTRMTCIGFAPTNDERLFAILKDYKLFN